MSQSNERALINSELVLMSYFIVNSKSVGARITVNSIGAVSCSFPFLIRLTNVPKSLENIYLNSSPEKTIKFPFSSALEEFFPFLF